MSNQPHPNVSLQLGLKGWTAIGLGLVIMLAMAVLAIGMLIFALPAAAIASAIYYFTRRSRPRPDLFVPSAPPRTARTAGEAPVIEGDFQIMDGDSK